MVLTVTRYLIIYLIRRLYWSRFRTLVTRARLFKKMLGIMDYIEEVVIQFLFTDDMVNGKMNEL